MWLLYQEAKTWGCRPSDLFDIEDPYAAYCLDQAVGLFGNVVTYEMDQVDGKNAEHTKRLRNDVLNRYLGIEDEEPQRGRFADPALFFK